MDTAHTCPECGARLPLDAPRGFCPACLVRLGIGWEATSSAEPGRPTPDHPVSLAATHDLSAADALSLNTRLPILFGGYELLQEIGRGGMGVIYKARQLTLNRTVALKIPLHGRFAEAAFVDRFRLEAEAAAQLDHPHIVPIYQVGVHQGQPFYSMKLIEGPSLEQEITGGAWRIEPDDRGAERTRQRSAATLVSRLAQAVRYAHERGILHRDIKPHNVLVDASGQPHLTDFGLAKLLNEESDLTLGSGIIGSPEFMAPEQAAGKSRQLTTAADVYGLGAVLYVLLTGKAVFHADTPLQTVRQVIEQEPLKPRALNPALDHDLETICLKCLQKEPASRYSSAHALAQDLDNWLESKPIQARRATGIERVWLWCRRQPVRASLAGALVLVAALGLSGVLWALQRATAGELLARQTAYAAEINLAQRALENGEVDRATTLVKRHRPSHRFEADLRDWEWRYLWNGCLGDQPAKTYQHSGIQLISASKDGSLLALAQPTGLSVRDLPDYRLVAELPDTPRTLTFTPSGPSLVLATYNEAGEPILKLWNPRTGQQSILLTNPAPAKYLACSPNGRLLAFSDITETTRVVEIVSGKTLAVKSLRRSRRPTSGNIAFLADENRLAIAGDSGVLLLWDWQTGQTFYLITQTADGVVALAVSPAGDTLAAGFGYTDGTIKLWDLRTRAPLGQINHHTAWVLELFFTADGRRLVSCGEDKTIRVFNVADLTQHRCFRAYRSPAVCMAVLPDGNTVISGADDGSVSFWDCSAPIRNPNHRNLVISQGLQFQTNANATPELNQPSPSVIRRFGLAYTPDSGQLITSDPKGLLTLRDARSLEPVRPLPELGANIWGVALSRDGQRLAVAKATGQIDVYDWKTLSVIATLDIPFEWVGYLWFSQTGRYLLAYSTADNWSTDFRAWETRHWSEIPAAHIHCATLLKADLSPDETLTVITCSNLVQLAQFPSGQPLYNFTTNFGCHSVRFSPDNRLLALGTMEGPIVLWDILNRRTLATLPGHVLGTWGIAFSPDGRRLLTAGRNAKDAVKLWDLVTLEELLTFPAAGQMFWDVRFSPDANTLAVNSFGGMAHFWTAPSAAELQAAEQRYPPTQRWASLRKSP